MIAALWTLTAALLGFTLGGMMLNGASDLYRRDRSPSIPSGALLATFTLGVALFALATRLTVSGP